MTWGLWGLNFFRLGEESSSSAPLVFGVGGLFGASAMMPRGSTGTGEPGSSACCGICGLAVGLTEPGASLMNVGNEGVIGVGAAVELVARDGDSLAAEGGDSGCFEHVAAKKPSTPCQYIRRAP
jgi:hypothetical protein